MLDTNTVFSKKLFSESLLPTRAHPEDAGLDLYSCETLEILPSNGVAVSTGIAIAIPVGAVGLVCDRSSMGKKGVKTLGGVIDAGYRGEVKVILWNLSSTSIQINKGDRIAQLLILPILTPKVIELKELDDTKRGSSGFGSTGI